MIPYDRVALCKELSRDEGTKLRVYVDTVGKRTIGTGRNLDDVGIRPFEAAKLGITKASVLVNGVTPEQALFLLNSDIDVAERTLDNSLPWWRTMDPVRQRVILNMCFNMGIGKLLGFHNTLANMRTKNYATAADGMANSAWAGQVGDRAARLEKMMRG